MIEYLKWDSDFFGLKIGRIINENSINDLSIAKLLEKAENEEYRCIYLEISLEDNLNFKKNRDNFYLADLKTTLNKKAALHENAGERNITDNIGESNWRIIMKYL